MNHDEAREILGLSETEATDSVLVKLRYRKLAQENHPDKGGDKDRFQRIKAAYEMLTGETGPDNSHAQHLERLQQLFMGAIEGGAADPVQAVKDACKRVQNDLKAQIAATRQAVRARERLLTRLRGKKADATVLQHFLRQDIEKHNASVRMLEEEIPKAQLIIDFLNDYEFTEAGDEDQHLIRGFLGSYS